MRQGRFLSNTVWRMASLCSVAAAVRCEIEIFGSPTARVRVRGCQLSLTCQFVLPVMGWPTDLTNEGHETWKRALVDR